MASDWDDHDNWRIAELAKERANNVVCAKGPCITVQPGTLIEELYKHLEKRLKECNAARNKVCQRIYEGSPVTPDLKNIELEYAARIAELEQIQNLLQIFVLKQ